MNHLHQLWLNAWSSLLEGRPASGPPSASLTVREKVKLRMLHCLPPPVQRHAHLQQLLQHHHQYQLKQPYSWRDPLCHFGTPFFEVGSALADSVTILLKWWPISLIWWPTLLIWNHKMGTFKFWAATFFVSVQNVDSGLDQNQQSLSFSRINKSGQNKSRINTYCHRVCGDILPYNVLFLLF